jgi:sulfite reductase alpha subunit-like flavoprotein
LSSPDSSKEIRHYEISITGSGLSYEAGDALNVIPVNCPELVTDIITAIGYTGVWRPVLLSVDPSLYLPDRISHNWYPRELEPNTAFASVRCYRLNQWHPIAVARYLAFHLHHSKNPFPGKLVTNRLLSSPDSSKEIRHYEISITGSGLSYIQLLIARAFSNFSQ